MNKFSTDAVIIGVSVTGESDRIVRLLTRNGGVIRAFAKGARKLGAKLHSSTALFVYGTFWITETKGVYNITDAEIKEMFFSLREDLDALTLAQYFCEIALKCVDEGASDEEHLRLLLNSLHFLCEGKLSRAYLKALYEIRTACLLGYSPDVIACRDCGEYETEKMYFDCETGSLYCSKCGNPNTLPCVPLPVVTAVRHVVFSPFNKIFSYDCRETDLAVLGRIAEKYFLNSVQLKFDTLDFYNNK